MPETKRGRALLRVLRGARVWLVLLASILAWWLVVEAFGVPIYLFPSPVDVIKELSQAPQLYLEALLTTTVESIVGFVLAALIGILLAVVMAKSRLLEDLLFPYLNIMRITPVVAIIPLLIIWFGNGYKPIIVVTVMIAIFPIVVGTLLGLKSVEKELIELMSILNASEFAVFRKIRLPNSLPHILASFRISAPLAVVGALVGEFVGGTAGMGYQLVFSQAQFNTPGVFLLIVLSALLGISVFQAVVVVERRLLGWHPASARV